MTEEIERLRAELAACKERENAEWVKAIDERNVARAERDALRAAISKAIDDLATIELEQEIYAAQDVRWELAAALKEPQP